MYIALFGLPRTLYIQGCEREPQNRRIQFFVFFGPGDPRNARKMTPRGVRTFCTPGKPISGNSIFRHFSDRHLNFRPTFHLHGPTALPWQLGSNPPSQVVDGSTRLQLGHGGFLPASPWTPELGPRPHLDPDPKILIPSEPRANPLTHPISLFPHLGAGGKSS